VREIGTFLDAVRAWAAGRGDILAMGIVGSHARGTARADSDVDLVILTETPDVYMGDDGWMATFGEGIRFEDEDWGLLQSRRVFYSDGLEVEFGITTREWAATNPVDAGTRRVIADGAQVVHDPQGIFAALIETVRRESSST
jgi:uncharacterized protein